MASDTPPPEPARRPISRRQKRKLIVAGLVIAVAAVIVLWGWSATGQSYLGISTLVSESQTSVPLKYANKTIELQGIVSDWSGTVTDTDFKLVDKVDATKSIEVVMIGTFPAGFDNGKTVAAKGQLADTLPLTLTATEMTVGCASKY